jgi:hypothetical protein
MGLLVSQGCVKIAKGRNPQFLPLLKNMNTKRYNGILTGWGRKS